jgi:glutathione peroxidase
MSVFTNPISPLIGSGNALDVLRGKVALVVNVASKCGLTPQYAALQSIHERFGAQGFTVLGVPCNQFMGQEPGTAAEISEFCSTSFNVTFPLTEKVDVNGEGRHPMYAALAEVTDGEGYNGDIRWNFEKFVVDRSGNVVARFHPKTAPDDAAVVTAIESALSQ